MTDETPRNPKQTSGADSNRRESKDEPGATAPNHSIEESLAQLPPGMNNNAVDGHDNTRGIRRPSQSDIDQAQNRHTLSASTIESICHFSERPVEINPVDDVLPTDLLFHSRDPFDSVDTFINSENLDLSSARSPGLLNEGALRSTVDDVESSLDILASEDTTNGKKQRLHQRPMAHRASMNQTNPLVFLKRGANKSTRLDAMLPAPLANDEDQGSPASTLVTGIESAKSSPDDPSEPAKSIENVADVAVRMMSRSIDAAGGDTLDPVLAREIRVNLTELLSEWQREESQRRNGSELEEISSFEKPMA